MGKPAKIVAVGLQTALMLMPLWPATRVTTTDRVVNHGLPSEEARTLVNEVDSRLPLSFEANRGQTDGEVKFLARGRGYALFLTSTEAVIRWPMADGRWPMEEPVVSPAAPANPKSKIQNPKSAAVRLRLVGGKTPASVAGVEQLPGTVNYFIGHDPTRWRTNIHTYAKVKYEGVYPGIDMVYYGTQGQLEYDFVVAPGANPQDILLDFEGAEKLDVDAQGDLVLHAAGNQLRQHRPRMYQEIDGKRIEIAGGFKIFNPPSAIRHPPSVAGFQVGPYDPARPLFIDPVLTYASYLGGSGRDVGYSVAVDSEGNIYVAGETFSSNFPTHDPIQPSFGGVVTDAFVAKLNPTGSALIYSTFLGGSPGGDIATSIAVDAAGNAYVTGTAASSNFPTTEATRPFGGGLGDAFVAKLSPTGSALVYSTFLGGAGNDFGTGVAVDASGHAFVIGHTASRNFPQTNGFQSGFGGGLEDGFVAKLNPTGSGLVYSTFLGGGGDDFATGIAVDTSGNVHVTGFTHSMNFPTASPLQPARASPPDAFVLKLNAAGSELVYSTYFGGSGIDVGLGIAVDAAGNAHVTGSTMSTDFSITNALQPTYRGGGDAFVAKFDPTGSALIYSTFLGGSNADAGNGVAVNARGDVYVIGETGSTDFPIANALQPALNGSLDVFVVKLDASGSTLMYSTYLGGSFNDIGRGIAVDTSGKAYITGETASTTFPMANPFRSTNGGGADAFLVKIADAAEEPDLVISQLIVSPLNPAPGEAVTVNFTIVNQGTAAAGSATHAVVLSSDTVLDSRDQLLRLVETPSVPPNGSSPVSVIVVIPGGTAAGTQFIGVIVDVENSIAESNEANNTASAAITVRLGSDLRAQTIRRTPPGISSSQPSVSDLTTRPWFSTGDVSIDRQ
jgi:hypothetical protein